jgi:hypothetical protein
VTSDSAKPDQTGVQYSTKFIWAGLCVRDSISGTTAAFGAATVARTKKALKPGKTTVSLPGETIFETNTNDILSLQMYQRTPSSASWLSTSRVWHSCHDGDQVLLHAQANCS